MYNPVSMCLLLGVLGCGLIGVTGVQAQSTQLVEASPPATKQYEPVEIPPPPTPLSRPESISPPVFIPPAPPPVLSPIPARSIPVFRPGRAIAGAEAAHRIFLLAPVAATYAAADLPQEEAALIERLRQLVNPDSAADDLIWASLFDAYVEREVYPRAIAAFNQLGSPSAQLLRFLESMPGDRPNPYLTNLLPTLESLVEQHFQADREGEYQALLILMRLYQAASLQAESRAIAQQLYAMEAEQPLAEANVTETTLMADETVQKAVLQSAEIAAIAGEIERRDRILQQVLSVANSAQFRQLNTASVTPDPAERESGLGQQALFLISVAQQLIAAEQSQQAIPLLDQAAQWLQQRPNFPFHENSQAETLILAYTAARQPAPVLELLQALGPNRYYQGVVQLKVIEHAASTGQDDLAIQVAQQQVDQGTSWALEDTLRRLASAGRFDAAIALLNSQTDIRQEQALPLVAAYAIQANRSDVATTLVQSPLPSPLQPIIPDQVEPELAAQLQDEVELNKQVTRWLDIAEELIQQEQTTQAQEILQRVDQQLETWHQSVRYQTESRPMRAWFTLAERYAQAGQPSQAITLLNRLWQQEQQWVAARVPTNQWVIPVVPLQPLPLSSYFDDFPFQGNLPSLAWQVSRPVLVLPPRPVPIMAPAPSPEPQSFQPQPTEAIAQLPPAQSKNNPAMVSAELDEFRRADYSRHYLRAGDGSRAWELFNSIPAERADIKNRLATDLLNIAVETGQPDVARQFFAIVYPAASDGANLSSYEAREHIETLIRIANLYIERMDSENARQVLQQAEAIAWTSPPDE